MKNIPILLALIVIAAIFAAVVTKGISSGSDANGRVITVAIAAFLAFAVFAIVSLYSWTYGYRRWRAKWLSRASVAGMEPVEDLEEDWEGMFGTAAADEMVVFDHDNCCFDCLVSIRRGNWRIFMGIFEFDQALRHSHGHHMVRHVTLRRSVCVAHKQGASLVGLLVEPENWSDRVKEALLDTEDIDFDDDPDFSRAFKVCGEEDSAVRSALTPALRRYLLDHRKERFAFETEGDSFAVFYPEQLPPEPGSLLTHAAQLADLLDRTTAPEKP